MYKTIIFKLICLKSFSLIAMSNVTMARSNFLPEKLENITQLSSENISSIGLNRVQQERDIASGVYGTSKWRIDLQGVLYIGGGEFPGVKAPWYSYSDQIKKIVFTGKVFGASKNPNIFSDMTKLVEIENFSNFDTSKITDMNMLFFNCTSLISLDLSNFDTRNVVNMGNMFFNCTSLISLDLSKFDTSNVVNMTSMFYYCNSLSYLDISNFDTSNVSRMSNMFGNNPEFSIKQLKLGRRFQFKYPESIRFPSITADSSMYTGKWQNIGTGTAENPAGNNIWSSAELVSFYDGSMDSGTYVWQRVKGANVTVRYVDTDGKKILEDVIKSGNFGESYTTEQKDITGYKFKEIQGKATGQFTNQPQTVVYVYTKVNPIVNEYYCDKNGKQIEQTKTTEFDFGHEFIPKPKKYIKVDDELFIYKGWVEELPTKGEIVPQEGVPTPVIVENNYDYYYIYDKADKFINITLPKEIVFGTFENNNKISSKKYEIRNNSDEFPIELSLEQFDKVKSSIKLLSSDVPDPTQEEASAKLNLHVNNKNVIAGLTETTPTQTIAKIDTNELCFISLEGTYFGNMSDKNVVDYKMNLKFKATQYNKN